MPLINRCGGGSAELQSKSKDITDSSYPYVTVTPDSGYDGLSKATVYARLIERSVTPSREAQTIDPISGYVGLSRVNVAAVTSYWTKDFTSNRDVEDGTFTPYMIKFTAPTDAVPSNIIVTQNYGNQSDEYAIATLHISISQNSDGSYRFFIYGYTQGGHWITEDVDSDFTNYNVNTEHFGFSRATDGVWQLAVTGTILYTFDTSKQHYIFAMY